MGNYHLACGVRGRNSITSRQGGKNGCWRERKTILKDARTRRQTRREERKRGREEERKSERERERGRGSRGMEK